MELFLGSLTPTLMVFSLGVAMLAGVVKGTVGFGMPLIILSGLTLIMPPELALPGLILPTLLSNILQAFRQGIGAARNAVFQFRLFLIIGVVGLFAGAQLVRVMSADLLLLTIGAVILVFALAQLAGLRLELARQTTVADIIFGTICGVIGGLSGVWGPPMVMYLTALNTEKTSQIRIQGVVYGLGALALAFAHLQTGIFNWATAAFSLALTPAAMVGMVVGTRISDRIDQAAFRRATLFVLILAGANLVRRALFG